MASCQSKSPSEPAPALNPVLWDTGAVRLQSDDFYIEAAGVKFYANVSNVTVGGDPGSSTYRTLELEWDENSTDMRLYIYFEADTLSWWSNEIRTYDTAHASNDGTQWVYYYGEFFKSPIGSTFVGDVDVTNDDSDNGVVGKLHFKGVQLDVF